MASARHDVHFELAGPAGGNVRSILAGVGCLIFFAPLFGLAYLMARAGGGPGLIGRQLTRPDGSCFTAWRFNTGGRNAGAAMAVVGGGFGGDGGFLE